MEQASASSPVDFVKKVGRGKTLSQDMTAAESRRAFDLLLDGAFKPAQFGAFLQALRIKELTQEELDALSGTFRERMPAAAVLPGARTLALNLASDTPRKGGLAALVSTALLRRLGVGVGVVRSAPALFGNRASFEESLRLTQALEAGLAAATGPATDGAAHSQSLPLVLSHCDDLVAGLKPLEPLRGELGFRSCLHTAEKLVNPWPRTPVLLGISHKHYALRMAATLASQGLDGKILLGNHGTVDLVLHKETELVSVQGGVISEGSVSPAELGLSLSSDVYSLGRLKDWDGWIADLSGAGAALGRVLLYHAAVLLWAAGAAKDPHAGLAAARSGLGGLFRSL